MNQLVSRIENTIAQHRLLRDRQRVLVAVSGGLDSMTLLHILHELTRKHRWKLTVAHFNHQLRGQASDADEVLVRQAAERLKLSFISDRADVRAEAKRSGASLEMAARKLRHAFFAAASRQLRIRTIATAHHSDDQVELFFLRLLRGAGSQGLGGMPQKNVSPADPRVCLIRPLLGESKDVLATFIRERKIHYREDATNTSKDILRNRIRHQLLPLLRKSYQPSLNDVVLRTMQLLRDEAAFTNSEAKQWSTQRKPEFSGLPVALQRRVLQSEFARNGLSADFALVERLRLNATDWFTITPSLRCRRTPAGEIEVERVEVLSFQSNEMPLELRRSTGEQEFSGLRVSWRIESGLIPSPSFRNTDSVGRGREFFDAEKVGARVVLRHWQAGDRFQPIGMNAAVKLQDLFVNQKIPRQRRHELVLATTAAGEVFWVEGLRISERFKLSETTGRRLNWEWKRT